MMMRLGPTFLLRSTFLSKQRCAYLCKKAKVTDSENQIEKKKDSKEKENEESAANKLNKLLSEMSSDTTFINNVKTSKPGKKISTNSHLDLNEESNERKKQKNKTNADTDLLFKLLGNDSPLAKTTNLNNESISLNDIIVGMKIDRNPVVKEKLKSISQLTRSHYVRRALGRDQNEMKYNEKDNFKKLRESKIASQTSKSGSYNLFHEENLGIFNEAVRTENKSQKSRFWNLLEKRDLSQVTTHAPRNYFEKMILWTEEGKLWKLPINNEEGLEEEKYINFSEHVLLDNHLEDWCPKTGPIRHFMELVCVGLSKNHNLSVQEKLDHIYWFKEYFENKKEILKEVIYEKSKKTTTENENDKSI